MPPDGAGRDARPLLHPLAGIGPWKLTQLLIEHGGISARYAHQLAIVYLGSILRWPFCAVERVRVARRVNRAAFSPPPIFIVGHWRSGTTYLYNLLSCDPQFCFPTILDALRPYEFYPSPFDFISRALLMRSLPVARPMDDVPLQPDLPQEDEMALGTMGAPSFFNCLYFPGQMSRIFAREVLFRDPSGELVERWRDDLKYYLAKLSVLHDRRLLIKNPAHSARLKELLAMFPDAAFIHIHRDPVDVLASTRKFFRTMLPLFALQDYDMADVEHHIAWSYPALMDALFEGIAILPPRRCVEIAYDDLVREPLVTVERIYRALGLQGFDAACRTMQTMVAPADRAPRVDTGDAAFGHSMADIVAPYRRRLGYTASERHLEAAQ